MSDLFLENFRTYALADSTLAATIGSQLAINSGEQGQSFPYAVFTDVSFSTGYNLDGPDGCRQSRLQIDVWATTRKATVNAREAFLTRFDGLRGQMGSHTFVQMCELADARGGFDPDEKVYHQQMDFMFYYKIKEAV